MAKANNNTGGTNAITVRKASTTLAVIEGGNGVDTINATSLWSQLNGTGTITTWQISGGNGADIINGSDKNEIIWGDSQGNSDTSANGADTINGGAGDDQVHGGNGGDLIAGDDGADLLWGDRGGDTFKYKLVGDSEATLAGDWSATTGDWIKDFTKAEGDKLDLGLLNGFLTGSGPSMLLWGSGAAAHGVWIGTSGGDKIVYVDVDGDTTADVAIKVTGDIDAYGFIGVNHAPDISLDTTDSATATKDETDAGLTASGTLSLTDADVPDTVNTSVSAASDDAGHFTEADLKAMMTLSGNSANAADPGSTHNLGWSWDSGSEAFDFLADGESLIITYTLTADDGHGGTDTQTLTITINGTNDGPDIYVDTGDSAAEGVSESNDPLVVSGSLSILDADTSDTVDSSVNATVGVGGTGPSGGLTNADFYAMFSLTGGASGNAADGTAGSLTWAFDSGTQAFDFLADGETLILTYTVDATDGTASDSQDVVITITGTNDAAMISGDDSNDITEDDPMPNMVSGTLTAVDADHDESGFQTQTSVATDYGTFSIDADGNWTYELDDTNTLVDDLDDGDQLQDLITVYSIDGTSKVVTITIHGHTDGGGGGGPYVPPPVYEGIDDPNDHDNDQAANKVVPGPVVVTDDPGSSTIYGSDMADSINAGNGNDAVYGYGGNDTIKGQGGADTSLFGQAGNDILWGGQGSDTIFGGSGNDTIYGNMLPPETDTDNQADFLYGGSGNDTIFGQSGADRIVGGYGADSLWGGAGDDTFVYLSNLDTGDTINDFSGADQIELDSAFGLALSDFGGLLASPGDLGSARVGYTWDGANTTVYVDTDGDHLTDLQITLVGNINLAASASSGDLFLGVAP